MKKKILEIIKQRTEEINWNKLDCFTASTVCGQLGVSRNVVSQYLNELTDSGQLLKIKSRPVYFIHKAELEKDRNIRLAGNVYKSVEELKNALRPAAFTEGAFEKDNAPEESFKSLIGWDGSLNYCIEQCKSAIAYPKGGLPLLLYGPTGTGKSMMARLMFDYGVQKGIFSQTSPFVTLNCSEYANNPELLSANLFGHVKGAYTGAFKDNTGLLQAADGGVLFLDEVHCLKAECQEKLFLFMDQGIFHQIGDNANWHTSHVYLIFATTENPEEILLRTLFRRIPIITHVPSLRERPNAEKHQLICALFRREKEQIGCEIFISNMVYDLLMQYTFKGNVGDLKNCIKACCANAFLFSNTKEKRLSIAISNLPGYILNFVPPSHLLSSEGERFCTIGELNSGGEVNKTLLFYQQMVCAYQGAMQKKERFGKILDTFLNSTEEYLNTIVYEEQVTTNPKMQLIFSTLTSICNIISNKYALTFGGNDIFSFSFYLYGLSVNNTSIKNYEMQNKEEIARIEQLISIKLSKEYAISLEIIELLQKTINLSMGIMSAVFLTLIIKSCNRNLNLNRNFGIILCHGHSTASSMAAAVNSILGNYLFDAIDIPLNGTGEEVLPRLKERLNLIKGIEELILLVDMGSLEEIYKGLSYLKGVDIGIINNVNTRLAVWVGEQMLCKHSIADMVRQASENNCSSYKVIQNRCKSDAILSVCATGIGSARKISELFLSSLPKKIDLEVIPYDYETIRANRREAPVFSKHNIKFIIGTLNPQVKGLPFLSLEELSSNKNAEAIARLLSPYLNEAEIAMFEQNLIKIFSLQNLLNYLTFLNADKVLGFVEKAVGSLQEKLKLRLPGSTISGLYLHISCLIEKLIMRTEETELENADTFFDTNQDFIKCVKESFFELEKYYSVEIPVSEIRYIYDYVYNSSAKST